MFFRVSTGVIAPDITSDLNLTATSLGLLGSAFFYSFAFMQIPMGPMLDILGPRTVMTVFVLTGASGSFLFAASGSFFAAFMGRVLMGIGMASVLMGSFKVLTLYFPNNRFATLAGLMVTIGTFGNVLAASPLAWLASVIGWRQAFVWAGVVTVVLGLIGFLILKNEGPVKGPKRSPAEGEASFQASARLVLRTVSFWQISGAAFFRYGTFVSLQGLWLGLYLMDVKGLTPVRAGNILSLLAIGNSIGSPIAGRIADSHPGFTKRVAVGGLTLYTLSLAPLVGLIPIHGELSYGVICFLIGFFHSSGTLLYAHSKDLFPAQISGTAMSWVNFFIMAGGAVLMQLIGAFIDIFPHTGRSYTPYAYQLSFLFCFLSMAASLVFYVFSKPSEKR